MIKREHQVRLAAAEIRLELHHRIARIFPEPLERAREQTLETLREESAAKKLHRVAVFVAALAEIDLPQVSGKLSLLVAALRHVAVRRHHLAPRFECALGLTFERSACRAAFLAPHLLVKFQPQQFLLRLLQLVRFGGRGN